MSTRKSGVGPACLSAVVSCLLLVVAGIATHAQAGTITADQLPTVTVRIEEGAASPEWTFAPTLQDYRPSGDSRGGYVLIAPREYDFPGDRAHIEIDGLQFDPD